MIEKIGNEFRSNHLAQMAVCCMFPVVLLIALQLLGFSGWWVYGLALVACIGSHLVMGYWSSRKGEKSCH
ncbi:MAG: hypothetical protein HY917_03360 [Candidatus Diapherotrites archaeon]|nr:hypothetical protein [Candidatus Diapherotrites archaeon]